MNNLCLNPYYNGRYSMSPKKRIMRDGVERLNPYYNGRYSMRSKITFHCISTTSE